MAKCDRCDDEVPPGENLIAHVLTLLLNNVAASFLNIGVIGVISVFSGIMSCDDIAGIAVLSDECLVNDNVDDDDKEKNERADVFTNTLHTLAEKVSDRQTVENDS